MGWDIKNLFEPVRTLVSDAGHWICHLVTKGFCMVQKKTRSINSYSGIWLWREIKAASSYKVPAPLALA